MAARRTPTSPSCDKVSGALVNTSFFPLGTCSDSAAGPFRLTIPNAPFRMSSSGFRTGFFAVPKFTSPPIHRQTSLELLLSLALRSAIVAMTLMAATAAESPESLRIVDQPIPFEATWTYFSHTRIEAARPELQREGELNVSAHFLVDRDGTIYRLMPETWMARHCIGLNRVAIGIENVGDGA